MFVFVRCVAEAVCEVGVRGLIELIPGGEYAGKVAEKAYGKYRKRCTVRRYVRTGHPAAHRELAIAGGPHRFEFGESTLPLVDSVGGRIDVRVVAKLVRDGGRLPLPLILGLRGGMLDGRRLTAEPDPAEPFGQTWTLEDP